MKALKIILIGIGLHTCLLFWLGPVAGFFAYIGCCIIYILWQKQLRDWRNLDKEGEKIIDHLYSMPEPLLSPAEADKVLTEIEQKMKEKKEAASFDVIHYKEAYHQMERENNKLINLLNQKNHPIYNVQQGERVVPLKRLTNSQAMTLKIIRSPGRFEYLHSKNAYWDILEDKYYDKFGNELPF